MPNELKDIICDGVAPYNNCHFIEFSNEVVILLPSAAAEPSNRSNSRFFRAG